MTPPRPAPHPGTATAPGLLAERARREPEAVAFRSKHLGLYRERTWSDYASEVARCALGFAALGLRRGDRAAILADPCEEWLICDLAVQALGGISYGIYPTSPAGEVEHLVRDGGASIAVAQTQEFIDKLRPLMDRVPALRAIVVLDRGAVIAAEQNNLVSFEQLLADGEERLRQQRHSGIEALEELAMVLDPHAPACLLYRAGTTAPPRAVSVTHRAYLAACATFADHYPALVRPGQRTVAHLPIAHSLGRQASIALPLLTGLVPHFGESMDTLSETFFEVAPTVLLTVPRYLEKYASQVLVGMAGTGSIKRRAYETATAFGRHFSGKRWSHSESILDRFAYRFLHWIALRPILNKLGFDQLQLVICGGASLPPEICTLWQVHGVNVVEVYGQAETAGAAVTGQPGPFPRPGDVGVAARGWEVDLGDGGEILVRNRAVPAATDPTGAAAPGDPEGGGWLHTGDLGEWTGETLRILGRVEDRIETQGGARVTPSSIELILRGSPYVGEVMVFSGEPGGPVALVEIDFDAVVEWARYRDVAFTGYESLVQCSEVVQLVEDTVARANAQLGVAERIQAFRILPQALDPSQEGGVLTPTRKIRRTAAREHFRALIESMTGASRPGSTATP